MNGNRNARPEARGAKSGAPATAAAAAGRKQYFRRRKVCKFCDEKIDVIDYKEVKLIGQFVSERGKILPRRLTGTCSPHQRLLAVAIKRARNIALLPFATEL
jgi:small subunit ribosomal protein S18